MRLVSLSLSLYIKYKTSSQFRTHSRVQERRKKKEERRKNGESIGSSQNSCEERCEPRHQRYRKQRSLHRFSLRKQADHLFLMLYIFNIISPRTEI
ncbi:unnamed protein product [Brassica napus]|uniref:(rape) hypothetical protein n=1 Tax=Brassica napus TaxID=3708 RepID=A0A816JLV8_BRANA|nr:unnamed protein product [Brassica napus]